MTSNPSKKKRALATLMSAALLSLSMTAAGAGASVAFGSTEVSGDLAADQQPKKCKKNKKKCKKKPSPSPSATASPTAPGDSAGGWTPGRQVELSYMGPAIGTADGVSVNPFGVISPVNFIAGAGETHVMIEISDALSPNTQVGFAWDSDGDGLNDSGFDVCGSTPEPVEISSFQVNVFPYLLPSTSCTDGVATSGTITVTFNKV